MAALIGRVAARIRGEAVIAHGMKVKGAAAPSVALRLARPPGFPPRSRGSRNQKAMNRPYPSGTPLPMNPPSLRGIPLAQNVGRVPSPPLPAPGTARPTDVREHRRIWLSLLLLLTSPSPTLGAKVPDGFPRFLVPGNQAQMDSLRRLYWLHYEPAGPLIPLWDEWMPMATLWPASSAESLRAMRVRWARRCPRAA
jgi:hypothetical protein